MTKLNEVKLVSKIPSLIDRLERSNMGGVLELIALYDLALLLSEKDLNGWLQIDDENERNNFLTNIYLDFRTIRTDLARQEAAILDSVDINLIRDLMPSIAAESLPSIEIAFELQKRIQGDSSLLTKEMAELSYKILFLEVELPSENIHESVRPAQVLCAGPSAALFSLLAGRSNAVDYDLYNQTGSGLLHIKRLLNIAGVDVRLLMTGEHNQIVKNRPRYKSGFLAEFGRGPFSSRNRISNLWSGIALEVNSLPTMMDQVSGRVICVVPTNWLSKTSAQDGSFKEHLVTNGFIEAVIQLPTGILYSSSLSLALLVINTSKINNRLEILFIDASGDDFTKQVSRNYKQLTGMEKIISLLQSKAGTAISGLKSAEDVFRMKNNLDVKRYVRSPTSIRIDKGLAKFDEVCRLGDIVEIIGCQAIKTEGKMFSQNDTVNEIGATNIDQYGIIDDRKGNKSITPIDRDVNRVKKQQLQAGDIIFAVKGSVGKCALIEPKYEGYITNQSFAILRLRKFPAEKGSWEALVGSEYTKLNGICLFSFLRSELGQAIVNQRVTGSVIPMIKTMDLEEIPVPIPEESVQAEYIVLHQNVIKLIDEKIKLEEKIAGTISSFWEL